MRQPKNPWMKVLHESMLRTRQSLTCREIETSYGNPPGGRVVSQYLTDSADAGFFRKEGSGRSAKYTPISQDNPQDRCALAWRYVEKMGQVRSIFDLGASHG